MILADNYSKDEIMDSLEKIAENLQIKNQEKSIAIPDEKSLSDQYMSTIIYDSKNNDNSLIIRNNETKKQSELNIKSEYNSFFIKNDNGNKIDLKNILNEQSYIKLRTAHKDNNIESFILNKDELNKLEQNKVIEKTSEIDKGIDINKDKDINNDQIYKALNSDKELMKQAMIFYQQSKVLDVLTKAREQLENVNNLIDNGFHSDNTKELQTNLRNDVNHLEIRANNLNNKLENSNVLGDINSKVAKTKEKTNEQTNEQNNESKKAPIKRSRTEDLSL